MNFQKFPSIEQFRHVVKKVKEYCDYSSIDRPVIKFKGTVKVHGTNAGIGYNPVSGEMWAQSRTRIIDVNNDNAGFAFFVESNKGQLTKLMKEISEIENNLESDVILFGEWCGGSIQKGVAVSELGKMFIAFALKIGDEWCNVPQCVESYGIFNINNFPTYEIDIDFNWPDKAVNDLTSITEQVERECPVGKYFGVSGIGEGVVWSAYWEGWHLKFKVKGEKHSVSKVSKLAKVDAEKVNSISNFVDMVVTEQRLNQGIEYVFTMQNIEPTIKMTGDFLRWVVNDVVKEELDTLIDNNLEPKDVNKYIAAKARECFIKYLDKETFSN